MDNLSETEFQVGLGFGLEFSHYKYMSYGMLIYIIIFNKNVIENPSHQFFSLFLKSSINPPILIFRRLLVHVED